MRAISQAHGALNALAALLPDTAERVMGQETKTAPLSELQVGDLVLVRPGARVPADGTVVEGAAEVDESMITGESRPVSKRSGAGVIAGTVATGASLRVRITAVGEETALSGIMRLVGVAQASGSRTQALADRAAATLFYVAVMAGAITMAYWWFAGDKEHALIRTATVLIIACPRALGLAIPVVIAISTSLGDGRYLRPFAKIILALAARREDQNALAQRLLRELREQYPGRFPLIAMRGPHLTERWFEHNQRSIDVLTHKRSIICTVAELN